jgi:DNA-binding NarL/FixJ family response regulator
VNAVIRLAIVDDYAVVIAGVAAFLADERIDVVETGASQEIADRAYLSINSVKTYIRSGYRKIGVQRRTQAVLWGVSHGFQPDTERTIDPALLLRPAAASRLPVL